MRRHTSYICASLPPFQRPSSPTLVPDQILHLSIPTPMFPTTQAVAALQVCTQLSFEHDIFLPSNHWPNDTILTLQLLGSTAHECKVTLSNEARANISLHLIPASAPSPADTGLTFVATTRLFSDDQFRLIHRQHRDHDARVQTRLAPHARAREPALEPPLG